MFRCPGCGRVHKVPLTPNYSILSNKDMNTFHIIKEPFYKDGNLLKAFQSILKEVTDVEEAIHFVQDTSGETVLFNQTCPLCHTESSLEDWMEAWKRPIDFFDAEQLCSCGEELWMDRIPYTNRFGLVCDKCEWVKPQSSLSGSADATVK